MCSTQLSVAKIKCMVLNDYVVRNSLSGIDITLCDWPINYWHLWRKEMIGSEAKENPRDSA